MAILQEYRKVSETEREVEYAFGFPEKDRTLNYDKVTRNWTVQDGRLDPAAQAVIRGILRRQQSESSWPNGGGVQH